MPLQSPLDALALRSKHTRPEIGNSARWQLVQAGSCKPCTQGHQGCFVTHACKMRLVNESTNEEDSVEASATCPMAVAVDSVPRKLRHAEDFDQGVNNLRV